MPSLNPGRALMSLVPESRPQRIYLLTTLINTYGIGLILTAMTLYAIKVVHLTPQNSGLALTIAGLVGLLAAMPMGALADRRGPRDIRRLAMLLMAASAVGFVLFARDFVSYLIVATVQGAALSASVTADVTLLRRVGGEEATTFRSQTQAVFNLGVSLGVATCGVAIQLNTVNAYRALFLGQALTSLIGVAIVGRLPKFEPLPGAHEESVVAALKDRPFLGYAVLSGAMYMQYFVLTLLLPVWVVYHTHAPRWSVSAFVIVNTVLVVLFQVRIGKTVQTIKRGGAAIRRAGVIFLVSCSAMGLATGHPRLGRAAAAGRGRRAAHLRRAVALLRHVRPRLRAGARTRAGAVPGPGRHGQRRRASALPVCPDRARAGRRPARLRAARRVVRPARPGRPRSGKVGRADPAGRARDRERGGRASNHLRLNATAKVRPPSRPAEGG